MRKLLIQRRAVDLLGLSRGEILKCSDGVRLKGYYTPQPGNSRGMVIFLHGWEGSADSPYLLSCATLLHRSGFEIFRLNFRDHGDTQALNEGLFHSCRINEVVEAISCIQRLHRARPTFLVGYSLGGNFALRTAVRAGVAGLDLAKVVAICPVLRPHSTMEALESGFWFYRHYFLKKWRYSLRAKEKYFPEKYNFGDLQRFSTISETTDFFVKNYTDFPDLDSYLDGYSITGDVLVRLLVPSRVFVAADDPIIPYDDVSALAASDSLRIAVLPRGGHCAFFSSYHLDSWVDKKVFKELQGMGNGSRVDE
ncbi:MAG: alpha/beta fold hydrolase [Gammaproteobacteria bacterium]